MPRKPPRLSHKGRSLRFYCWYKRTNKGLYRYSMHILFVSIVLISSLLLKHKYFSRVLKWLKLEFWKYGSKKNIKKVVKSQCLREFRQRSYENCQKTCEIAEMPMTSPFSKESATDSLSSNKQAGLERWRRPAKSKYRKKLWFSAEIWRSRYVLSLLQFYRATIESDYQYFSWK